MTEDEFVRRYAEGSGFDPEEMRQRMLTVRNAEPRRCNCGKEYCDGWAWQDVDLVWLERGGG